MNKNNLNELFENLEGGFDLEHPNLGHEQRFLNKLKKEKDKGVIATTLTRKSIWKPLIGIAATIILLVSLVIFSNKDNSKIDLAEISPEMAQTQTLFTAVFTNELNKLNSEETPEHQELIVDALFRIKVIEEDYNQLVIGLKENPDDPLILSAMIMNFQSRIDVLQDVLQQIEESKLITNKPTTI